MQAVIVNYFTAGLCGLAAMNWELKLDLAIKHGYWIPALIIGLMFIITFNLIALGIQKIGISITTVANKMSLVIPVIIGLTWWGESANLFIISGIILALLAIYLTSTVKGKLAFNPKFLWLIVVIFVGQGIADATISYAQKEMVPANTGGGFLSLVFFFAALLGSIFLIYEVVAKGARIKFKNIIWGILLGVPNYFTLKFFIGALQNSGLDDAQIFPVINMGVIVMMAFIGLVAFREKLSKFNWIGIFVAVVSIALITFSKEIIALF